MTPLRVVKEACCRCGHSLHRGSVALVQKVRCFVGQRGKPWARRVSILLFVLLVAFVTIVLYRLVGESLPQLNPFAAPAKAVDSPSQPSVDLLDRDDAAYVDFRGPRMAFKDLNESEQQAQRLLYAEWARELQGVGRTPSSGVDASEIVDGERDPNAFRRYLPVRAAKHLLGKNGSQNRLESAWQMNVPPLPRLTTRWRTHSVEELYERYDALDVIYSFVNGTEANHVFRKSFIRRCMSAILAFEERHFRFSHPIHFFSDGAKRLSSTTQLRQHPLQESCPLLKKFGNITNSGLMRLLRDGNADGEVDVRDRETDELRHSVRSVEQHIRWHRGRLVVVSPGHHPTWVDGAKNFLAGVCGGADVQALRRGGTHVRLTTVHQDAVMPYGMRLTVDSHSIEANLWRVRNITAVHVYMNDDYFVNRDVAITDLLNEYGGAIVREEGLRLPPAARGGDGSVWDEGMKNTRLFNIQELEYVLEDYLPERLVAIWRWNVRSDAPPEKQQGNASLPRVPAAAAASKGTTAAPKLACTGCGREEAMEGANVDTDDAVRREAYVALFHRMLAAVNTSFVWEAAALSAPVLTPLPNSHHKGTIPRYYPSHAPFVYCTNIFRYFSVRYQYDFAHLQLHHRERAAQDLLMPFLFNAFILDRPWVASPQFIPYLLKLREVKAAVLAAVKDDLQHHMLSEEGHGRALRDELHKHLRQQPLPSVAIHLDNADGCAPATMYHDKAGQARYFRATNDLLANAETLAELRSAPYLFFNINAGFSSAEVAQQLRTFMDDKYPTPVYLEERGGGGSEDVLGGLFRGLMALPVVGVVSFEEGACPLVRSLALAFAGHHRGRVEVVVQSAAVGGGEAGTGAELLRDVRAALGHRVVSAMPAVMCAYGARVRVGASSARGEPVAAVARRVLDAVDAGAGAEAVVLPSTCGGGSGGLRVRGFVVDARTAGVPLRDARALRDALATPGQTVSLEDFRAVRVGPTERDVALVLSRSDADAKAVHWVSGASENDLLVTFPLPVAAYEDMAAEVRWSAP